MSDNTAVATRFHRIKCDSQYFDAVRNRTKTFEIRLNDRGYQAGDELELVETNRHGSWATGRRQKAIVGYVYSGLGMDRSGCGYVALSLLNVEDLPDAR